MRNNGFQIKEEYILEPVVDLKGGIAQNGPLGRSEFLAMEVFIFVKFEVYKYYFK